MSRLRLLLLMTLWSCGGAKMRHFQVVVDTEQLCRTFDPVPENCALTNGAALQMTISIEDKDNHSAVIYGRSDSSSQRAYVAQVPKPGRYEVLETLDDTNSATLCATHTRLVVALDVDDKGLSGGEENRVEEDRHCNTSNQHRVTRRLREWRGSKVTP